MGKALLDFYNKANKLGGEKAVMRLVVITGITRKKAEEMVDDEQIIETFEQAINEIEKDYK